MKIMLKKFLKQKRAQHLGPATALPLQAFVEIFMIVGVGLLFLSYGSFLLKDTKPYQIFYSKDLSLLQSALLLTNQSYAVSYYSGEPNTNFHNFGYVFKKQYSDVVFTKSGSATAKDNIVKSYVHYLIPSITYTESAPLKVDKFYFQKIGNNFQIDTSIEPQILKEDCPPDIYFGVNLKKANYYIDYSMFPASEQDSFDNLVSLNFGTSDQFKTSRKISLNQFINMRAASNSPLIKVYIAFMPAADNQNTMIYSSFANEGKLACELYNSLASRNTAFIQTSSIEGLDKGFTYSVVIYSSKENIPNLFKALKNVIQDAK
jgi:hypothetical protein